MKWITTMEKKLFSKELRAVKTPLKSDVLTAMANVHANSNIDEGPARRTAISPLAASKSERYAPYLKHAVAELRRIGFDVAIDSNDLVPLGKLDRYLRERGADISVERRFEIKAALGAAGLIL
jgi:hypothetical protein